MKPVAAKKQQSTQKGVKTASADGDLYDAPDAQELRVSQAQTPGAIPRWLEQAEHFFHTLRESAYFEDGSSRTVTISDSVDMCIYVPTPPPEATKAEVAKSSTVKFLAFNKSRFPAEEDAQRWVDKHSELLAPALVARDEAEDDWYKKGYLSIPENGKFTIQAVFRSITADDAGLTLEELLEKEYAPEYALRFESKRKDCWGWALEGNPLDINRACDEDRELAVGVLRKSGQSWLKKRVGEDTAHELDKTVLKICTLAAGEYETVWASPGEVHTTLYYDAESPPGPVRLVARRYPELHFWILNEEDLWKPIERSMRPCEKDRWAVYSGKKLLGKYVDKATARAQLTSIEIQKGVDYPELQDELSRLFDLDMSWLYWPKEKTAQADLQEEPGHVVVDVPRSLQHEMKYNVLKRNTEKRYTLGIAYPANRKDAHGDYSEPDDLEKTAWLYMIQRRGVGLMHQPGTDGSGIPVESYIYRGPDWKVKTADGGEEIVKNGDWLLGVIWNKTVWAEKIKTGKYKGYSLQGFARDDDDEEETAEGE